MIGFYLLSSVLVIDANLLNGSFDSIQSNSRERNLVFLIKVYILIKVILVSPADYVQSSYSYFEIKIVFGFKRMGRGDQFCMISR